MASCLQPMKLVLTPTDRACQQCEDNIDCLIVMASGNSGTSVKSGCLAEDVNPPPPPPPPPQDCQKCTNKAQYRGVLDEEDSVGSSQHICNVGLVCSDANAPELQCSAVTVYGCNSFA